VCLYVYSLKRKSRVLFVLCDFYFVLHVLQKEHYFILFSMFDISSWVGTQHVFLESKSKSKREKKISINNIDSNIENEQSLLFFKNLKRDETNQTLFKIKWLCIGTNMTTSHSFVLNNACWECLMFHILFSDKFSLFQKKSTNSKNFSILLEKFHKFLIPQKLKKYLSSSPSFCSSYHHRYSLLLYFFIVNIIIFFFFTSWLPTSSLSSSSSSILHHPHFLLLLLLNDIFHLMTLKLHTYMMRNYCQTSCIQWLKST
jgi:hypothetical protein